MFSFHQFSFTKKNILRNLVIYFGISSEVVPRKFAPAVIQLTYGGVHSKFLPVHDRAE
jgi:hypothetical protein